MIPRLQLAYGGDPARWLHGTPAALLRAFVAMLPRLEARRELASISAMGAAFGGMKRSDRQRYIGNLQRAARDGGAARPASPTMLAAMGIGVVMVPPKPGGPADG